MTALLRLIRLPNTLTAAADVLAGAALAGVPLDGRSVLAASGSAAFYGGGIALNDLLDIEKDRRLHPERPLARGDVKPGVAALVIALLFSLGLVSAWFGDDRHRILTVALLVCIIAYDVLSDRIEAAGPVLMGGCRGLNLARGIALGAPSTVIWFAPLAPFALILLITGLSRREDRAELGRVRLLTTVLALPYLAPAGLALLAGYDWLFVVASGIVGLGLWWYVSRPALSADSSVGRTIFRCIFTLTLFDALFALVAGQLVCAAVLVSFLPLMLLLKRLIAQKGS